MMDIIPYIDLQEANEYFYTRLDTQDWDFASEAEKVKALKSATRSIDRLNFKGTKIGEYEFPRLEWPIIPNDIKIATCEIAIQFLNGVDTEQEIKNIYITNRSYASVSTGNDSGIVPDHIRAGIPSAVAWLYLRPYLNDPLECRVNYGESDERS
jgi:hypothetical protein